MRTLRWTIAAVLMLAAACGGGQKTQVEPDPEPVVEVKKKPPPPPPPVCVRAGTEQSLIGMVEADDTTVSFCVSDGAESNKCYAVDLGDKKYSELAAPPKGQSPVLDPDPARLETTNTEVKVCVGEDCKSFKPKVAKGNENPIDAVANATGTYAAVLLGNAEKGKGTVEVWDVVKKKKTATIKYAKGDFKCGEARMLGNTVFISASVCSGPAAHGWLYNLKGKKVADVGGKEFGTYGTVPVQLTETVWAFLEEAGAAIAIQDVSTGKVAQTIDIGGLWDGPAAGADASLEGGDEAEGGGEAAPPAMGNPGESALVRGGEGKLIVVSGGPAPGNVGVVEITAGTLADQATALPCEPEPGEAPVAESDDEPAAEE